MRDYYKWCVELLNNWKQKNVKTIAREIRLDDKTAQFLIDFLTEDTKFINESGIKFIETTNPKLFYPTRLD